MVGICQCGCGRSTPVAPQTNKARGWVKGQPIRFVHGHHGRKVSPLSTQPEYAVWSGMWRRCQDPNAKQYADYGGRGITVCAAWESYTQFLLDMGTRPTPVHTLERTDNDAGYSAANCRWATRKEQGRNRRDNLLVDWDGRRIPVSELAEIHQLPSCTLRCRIARGWPVARAISTPVRKWAAHV